MSHAKAHTATRAVAPIRATVEVGVPPARAFDVFTKRMTEWWPAEYAMVPTPRQVIVEPKVGGRPKLATEVEVRFIAAGNGTRVELEHRDLDRFGEQAEATRAGLSGKGGWGDLLLGFAAVAGKH